MKFGIRQHRFGVNYTPTRAWWYCWNDFEENAIARDLDGIAAIGADHIRIMLFWHDFQPNPQSVSGAHLRRLERLMGLAAERELDVCISLFVGWLSGYAFKPAYQADSDFYLLEKSLEAQELFIRAVAETVSEHKNFLGFDLGNELNCCWKAENMAVGDHWNAHMLSLAKELLPEGVHVNGVDHQPWFQPATFSPTNLAQSQPIVPLHCWSYFTGALERSGLDVFHLRVTGLLAGMAQLARAYSNNHEKPVWIQEFGMAESWTNPHNIPSFLQKSILRAVDEGVSWFTWWCSHDLDRQYMFDPLEYTLGLITLDGQIKPQGQVFKEIADTYRGRQVNFPTATILPALPDHTPQATWHWLDLAMEIGD